MKYKIKNNNNFGILDFLGEMFIRAVLFISGPLALIMPVFTNWKNDNTIISVIFAIIWLGIEYRTTELCNMVEEIKEEKTTDNKEVEEYLIKWSKNENTKA